MGKMRPFLTVLVFTVLGLSLLTVALGLFRASEDSGPKLTAVGSATILPGALEQKGNGSAAPSCSFSYSFTPKSGEPVTGAALKEGACGPQERTGYRTAVYYDAAQPSFSSLSNPQNFLNDLGWLAVMSAGFLSLIVATLLTVGAIQSQNARDLLSDAEETPDDEELSLSSIAKRL